MDSQQKPVFYAQIEAGKRQPQKTRQGRLAHHRCGRQALGYFEIGDRAAKAIVPK